MITVPEATQTIIKRSRYLTEAISKGIINNSSLARYIKPEIEEMLVKKVSISSIIMALKRVSSEIKPKYFTGNVFKTPPQIIVHSNLDSKETKGLGTQEFKLKDLSSITIKLPYEAIKTPGILYFFVKSIAWEGINIIKVETSASGISLIFEKKDINRAFSIIQSLFSKSV
ncbi:MAG: hypothetical protein HYT08_02085 [Candidatus Levybacteria bacterium]|nr:hypothetical protein [Candidatus Levybacteria bacterium]